MLQPNFDFLTPSNSYRYIGAPNQEIEDYNTVVASTPHDAKAYNTLGIVHNNNGEYDLAISNFSKAIELDSEVIAAYNNRGIAYAEKSEFDLAIVDFTKAIELDPHLSAAYSNRATVYYTK